jgi:hypothetical protein
MNNPEVWQGWSGKRLLVGVLLPPFIAGTLWILFVEMPNILRDEPSWFDLSNVWNVYIAAYLWGGIQSIVISVFMEWVGRRIFLFGDFGTKKHKLIYITIGSLMGVIAVLALFLFASDTYSEKFIVDCLVAGFLMSLIMLRLWQSEIESNHA